MDMSKIVNSQGRNFLHVAFRRKHESMEPGIYLLKQYPMLLTERDVHGKLPTEYLAEDSQLYDYHDAKDLHVAVFDHVRENYKETPHLIKFHPYFGEIIINYGSYDDIVKFVGSPWGQMDSYISKSEDLRNGYMAHSFLTDNKLKEWKFIAKTIFPYCETCCYCRATECRAAETELMKAVLPQQLYVMSQFYGLGYIKVSTRGSWGFKKFMKIFNMLPPLELKMKLCNLVVGESQKVQVPQSDIEHECKRFLSFVKNMRVKIQ